MGQWRKNLNARQRKNSRKPKAAPTPDETVVYDKPCHCRQNKGQAPGHIHASAPAEQA